MITFVAALFGLEIQIKNFLLSSSTTPIAAFHTAGLMVWEGGSYCIIMSYLLITVRLCALFPLEC